MNIKFTEGDKVLGQRIDDLTLLIVILSITVAVWESNHLIQKKVWTSTRRLSLKLIYRFGLSVFTVALISLLASYTVSLLSDDQILLPGFKQTLGFAFRINLFLHCVNAISQYNKALSKSQLQEEQLKKQTSEAKLEALKNQIQPHFLFNNLNTLASIIEEDPSIAVKYLNKLSKVYRYLLQNTGVNLVSLKEELEFLESYLFLLRIRFQDSLNIDVDLANPNGHKIPPATLQLLVENAIKHNEVSSSFPLKIHISEQSDKIVVKNAKKLRSNKPEKSGLGLANIKDRYMILTTTIPEVLETEDNYIVKLPII
ncbi:MAG: histidine kinase [Ekhidna sp.]|nr:histidine kinase [Ekhidna sp.]